MAGLAVAVTGPTGEIGISTVEALERDPAVDRIVGMARRPFDPAAHGWTKTTYQQGDILDRKAVDALVAEVDVVIHLAFVIMGSREESARVNLAGTRNVFEATVAAQRPRRLVYTSSVAAYGYHSDNPVLCVGSVGMGRFARELLGSTAASLAEAARCPVAIIRTQQRPPTPESDWIVVPVNDSPGNDDVIQQAMEEAQLRHAPVLALGVWQEDRGETHDDEPDRPVQVWRGRYPDVHIDSIATHAGVADYLAEKERRVLLAVIGSTDADEVAGLIGPHSHHILGHAECSVLIVRS